MTTKKKVKKTAPQEGEVIDDKTTQGGGQTATPLDTDNQAVDGEVVDVNEIEQLRKNAADLEKALVAHPGMEVVPGVTTEQLRNALGAQTEQRVLIKQFIQHHLVPDIDFGRIHVVKSCDNQYTCTNRYHFGKDMLFKPGMEKVFSLFGITTLLERDEETYKMLPDTKNLVAYICKAMRGDNVVAEGRGAAVLGDKGRDVNSTIKIAEKRARMDACLALGFSEYFSQDLDDPDYAGQRQQAEQRAAAEYEAKHPKPAPEPPKAPGENLPHRAEDELADTAEKTELYKAFLKAGLDKTEQLEVLAVNGITEPAKMSSGQAREMIKKLNDNAFKRPESKDVVIDDVEDGPIDLSGVPDGAATAAPAPEPKKEVELPPLVVDDDLKAYIAEQLGGIDFNPRGNAWFKRLVSGKPYGNPDTWTADQWRRAYDVIQDILDCKITVDDTYMHDPINQETPDNDVIGDDSNQAGLLDDDQFVKDVQHAAATGATTLPDHSNDTREHLDGDPRDL